MFVCVVDIHFGTAAAAVEGSLISTSKQDTSKNDSSEENACSFPCCVDTCLTYVSPFGVDVQAFDCRAFALDLVCKRAPSSQSPTVLSLASLPFLHASPWVGFPGVWWLESFLEGQPSAAIKNFIKFVQDIDLQPLNQIEDMTEHFEQLKAATTTLDKLIVKIPKKVKRKRQEPFSDVA